MGKAVLGERMSGQLVAPFLGRGLWPCAWGGLWVARQG